MLAQGMRANVFESQGRLVDVLTCIDGLFEGERKPSLRTFRKWQALGLIPFHKIGRLTFFDPLEVRAALDKRCRVQAIEY
jgi:hypothetical protein